MIAPNARYLVDERLGRMRIHHDENALEQLVAYEDEFQLSD